MATEQTHFQGDYDNPGCSFVAHAQPSSAHSYFVLRTSWWALTIISKTWSQGRFLISSIAPLPDRLWCSSQRGIMLAVLWSGGESGEKNDDGGVARTIPQDASRDISERHEEEGSSGSARTH